MAEYSKFWLMYLYTLLCLVPCLGRQIDLNTQGASCTVNEYGKKSEDGEIRCISCDNLPLCPHGLGVSISCGDVVPAKTDIDCVPCVPGKTFSAGYDNLPCKKCKSTLCHKDEKILGSCKVDNDNSSCGGVCARGFYPRDGDLSHCQPCSTCQSNASILVKKCKDDGLPVEKQCEMVSLVTVPSEKQGPLKPNRKGKNYYRYRGYEAYGHPLLLSAFVITILVLGLCLAFILMRRKCRKKRRSVYQPPEELPPLASDANGTGTAPSADGGSNEMVSTDVSLDTSIKATARKRISSTGSGGRKVSISRQISSNSNAGLDINDQEALLSSVADGRESRDDDNFQEQPSQKPERKRTISQGSSGKRSGIFTRQNSNPIPEHDEEKPFKRRSNTFSNFTSFSGQKMGNKEETTSLLSQTDDSDDDFEHQVVALPGDTEEDVLSFDAGSKVSGEHDEIQPLQKSERKRRLSQGSSRRRNSILSRQNSNPILEHGEEEETNSLLSHTDFNDNNLGQLALPKESKGVTDNLV